MEPSRTVKYTIGTSIPGDERRSYLRESFAGYDRNHDGFITRAELMDVWGKCLRLCDANVQAERVENEVMVGTRLVLADSIGWLDRWVVG